MIPRDTLETVRDLASQHQLVTVIGARDTGKSQLAQALDRRWQESGVRVVRIDAGTAEAPADSNEPLAAALGCSTGDLSAEALSAENPVRLILDRCERLYGRVWLAGLQEPWRALLSSSPARGRLGMVLFGRPLFRKIAGGHGSPLLNLGPVITVSPLDTKTVADLAEVEGLGVDIRLIRSKTGGHPGLTRLLIGTLGHTALGLKDAIQEFVDANRRYIFCLAEDHTLGGQAMLRDLLGATRPVKAGTLIRAHYGSAYAVGLDVLDDLVASGLVERNDDEECAVRAQILRDVPALRDLLHIPDPEIPSHPGHLAEAATIVFAVENELRRSVISALSQHDANWWVTRVPPQMAGDAEARRGIEADVLGSADTGLHPVMYLGLGELVDLIIERANWDQVFRLHFLLNRQGVQDAARRLLVVRNRVAHSRPVRPEHISEFTRAAETLGVSFEQSGARS